MHLWQVLHGLDLAVGVKEVKPRLIVDLKIRDVHLQSCNDRTDTGQGSAMNASGPLPSDVLAPSLLMGLSIFWPQDSQVSFCHLLLHA